MDDPAPDLVSNLGSVEGTLRLDVEPQNAEPSTMDQLAKSQAANSAEVIKVQNALKARKRTKTGCLTCRKRRIKCGEERPTCANCIKSKRGCEGYAPRLTFKDPLSAFRTGWFKGTGAHYQALSAQNGAAGQYGRPQSGSGSQSQLPVIAPRLPLQQTPSDYYSPAKSTTANWSGDSYGSYPNGFGGLVQVSDHPLPRMRQMYQRQDSSSSGPRNTVTAVPTTGGAMGLAPAPTLRTQYTGESNGGIDVTHPIVSPAWQQNLVPSVTPKGSVEAPSKYLDHLGSQLLSNDQVEPASQSMRPLDFDMVPNGTPLPGTLYETGIYEHGFSNLHATANLPFITDGYQGTDWGAGNGHQTQQNEVSGYPSHKTSYEPIKSEYAVFNLEEIQNCQVPHISQPELDIDEGDDDYFDVASDEGESNNNNQIASTPQNDWGLMVALSASRDDRTPRSYTTFLNGPNILSTYQPKFTASPLMDSMTARIFCHFITATGPSLSMYERHPQDSSMMFSGEAVPSARQALWTYTLPMKALSNQALLHAMLALASLHIAKLQDSSVHTSLKHYHYAIRRIAKAVASPSKRTNISTIAATLILSFYEASSSEHSVWKQHLTGARQLLMEVDYTGMTKRIKEEKTRAKAGKLYSNWQNPYSGFSNYHGSPNEEELDEGLINQLMGRKIRYDEFGRIIDADIPVELPKAAITTKDIEEYKIYGDLFFWYCKQDMYQSLISGNRLLLPYNNWSSCPPRARIGKPRAIYGTMDHLILLMGRIADFSSRDLIRKKKVVEANGGQWRPPPGMFPGPPPGGPQAGSAQPRQASYTAGKAQPTMPQPPMYGMIPNIGPAPMPPAFFSAPRDKLYFASSPTEEIGLEAAKFEAEQEWQDIRNALEAFQNSLGDEFQPLTADLAPPLSTPFGDSIEYRTWSISCIWIMWLTGAIVLARTHPSMPPAAMVAAGVAAPQTAYWAKRLGRICAGLQPARSNQPLNPSLGAALMESTLGMFFAGVQYQDPHQRKYIIDILRNITELTGWTSSSMIGAGLEVSWTRMAEAGRGPPYRQTYNVTLKDESDEDTAPYKAGKHTEKRLVVVKPKTRENFAMGIMSMESDFLAKDFTNLSVTI